MDRLKPESLDDQVDRLERQLNALRVWVILGNIFAGVALLLCCGLGLVLLSGLFVATGPPPVAVTGSGANAAAPVATSGAPVTAETPLAVGMKVLVKWQNGWWNADVLALFPDGQVRIHYTGWDARFDEVVSRERIRLPQQPAPAGK
jgi:hypothetical protein